MTYYINPILFYLMNVSEGVKSFFGVVGGLAVIICIIIFFVWSVYNDIDFADLCDDEKKVISAIKKTIIASLISIFVCILIPSKETCIEMMIASQVTHENVQEAKEDIYEIIDYVTDKLNEN